MNVHTCADAAALAEAVAARVVLAAHQAIAAGGAFHLALAGGTTPMRCYRQLRTAEIEWPHVHIWFGDERCLPVGDDDRNDSMAREVLLDHVPIPAAQIHAIPAELGAEAAAAEYAGLLAGAPALDMILLGMGEDGHTASLFPANAALTDKRLAVPVFNAPKPPAERVSLGYAAINRAALRLMLITGLAKHEALMRIQSGEALPAARIQGCDWYVDAAAWYGIATGHGRL